MSGYHDSATKRATRPAITPSSAAYMIYACEADVRCMRQGVRLAACNISGRWGMHTASTCGHSCAASIEVRLDWDLHPINYTITSEYLSWGQA